MLAKFSVKKPYTILVAVVLVIVLGVVSFLNMTPNLMPNMELPYVMVMTTYAGATPEEVEEQVTKPAIMRLGKKDEKADSRAEEKNDETSADENS